MIDFWNRFRRDRLAVYSLGVIALFVAAAILASMLAPYDPSAQFFDGLTPEGSPLPPSARFWFGTDTNGRDQFSRLLCHRQPLNLHPFQHPHHIPKFEYYTSLSRSLSFILNHYPEINAIPATKAGYPATASRRV